jgi:hypothetical protein
MSGLAGPNFPVIRLAHGRHRAVNTVKTRPERNTLDSRKSHSLLGVGARKGDNK